MAYDGEIGSANLVFGIGDTTGIELAAGTYTAGSVIVHNGTTGGLTVVDCSIPDKRVGILLFDVDTTQSAAAVVATGTFNLNKITFESTQDYAGIGGCLQTMGIFLKDAIKA